MNGEAHWRILLNECKGSMSRLIFTNRRCLVDITIKSQNVGRVVHNVLCNSWSSDQLMTFLHSEADQVLREAL
ncbi:MAG: hypothetical protein P4N41_24970 [Negativicutes bacterium]|nr:hypothetical protein [Negativicutes bacterium]